MHPLCYLLLPNKTEKTYYRMLELLCEETNAKQDGILADFEKAALNAFSKKFPDANISCCYFHLTQSFNRKMNEVGLKVSYENCPDFNLALRMLPALAHVPPCQEIAEVIESESFDDSIIEKWTNLLSFLQTFI